MKNEIHKKEFTLEVTEFGDVASMEGLHALAKNIQTLLFLEKGSYPNSPDMGIGIETFLFEFFDDSTINIITSTVKEQIATYLPNTDIQDIVIQEVETADPSYTSLGLLFILGEPVENIDEFIILLKKQEKDSKIISRIIY